MPVTINKERDKQFSDHAKKLLKDFYMTDREKSPQEAFARAAEAWSAGDDELAQRLYDASSKNWFVFASPVLSNAPKKGAEAKGMPISCFLSYVGDNLHSLINHTTETRWLSVKGGGVGGHWSDVRAVSDIAPGPVPFLHTIDADMIAYRQGKTRKGSYAAYMDVSHPDIIEFIGIRTPTGDANRKCLNLNHGVNVTNKFMDAVISGGDWELLDPKTKEVKEKIPARQIWEYILETRYRTGEPYINFIDTANENLPEAQKKLGLKIHGSNLCVAPETKILTCAGYQTISELEDKTVHVWNGEEFSETQIIRTSEGQELIKVNFSNGTSIECTPYHKFYIQNNYGGTTVIKPACKLNRADKLRKENLPEIEVEDINFNSYFYTSGFFTGVGCEYKGKNHIDLYHDKIKLKNYMEYVREHTYSEIQKTQRISLTDNFVKFSIPFGCDIEAKLNWLAGLFDADGTVVNNGTNQSIQLASINRDFLIDLMLFLQEIGINSKVVHATDAEKKPVPDGKGGSRLFDCKEAWRILISSSALYDLMELGTPFKRLKVNKRKPQRNAEQFVYVTSIEKTNRRDVTFCCTEPKRNTIFLNGVSTGNCNEIHLATNEERTAVCCLSSVNLEYYDEWKDTNLVRDLVRMLDNIISFFVGNAPDELKKAKYSALRERSIGIGAMGWHSYLQKNSVAFESDKAATLNAHIFADIKDKALAETKELAKYRGEAPDMAGTGRRNAHLLAIAPNANSSIIADTSPSIEPWNANAFVHRTRAGSFLVKNKFLEAIFVELEMNNEDTWSDIISHNGSVQHLEFLDAKTKKLFKTAMEIDQNWVIRHASDRQKFICQGQSVNLFFPSGVSRGTINKIHMDAWKNKLKGLYYLRTEASSKAENVGDKVERVALSGTEEPVACNIDDKDCQACMV